METFTVTAVIDGNTFEVSPKWEYGDDTGERVQAVGYDAPKAGKRAMAAEQKLSILLQNKKVELGEVQGVERGRLVCEAYFEGRNLASYFREYGEQKGEPFDDEFEDGESVDDESEDSELFDQPED